MARYECVLNDELLDKAVRELNEPRENSERLKAIDILRDNFDATKYGELVRSDDAFLLRFLRARKFDQERALHILQNYHTIRNEFREVFSLVEQPHLLKDVMDSGVMYVINGKSRNGESVLIYRPRNSHKISMYQLMACGVIFVEELLEDEEYQICGNITVDDVKEFSLRPVFQMSFNGAKKFNQIWQDSMPIRIKNIYMFNEGRVFDIVYAIFKPFMRSKMKKRIRLCGKDYIALHNEVDPSLLPPELLGTGSTMEDGVKEWVKKIQDKHNV